MIDKDILSMASDLSVVMANAFVDLMNNPNRTSADVNERIIMPIYNTLKELHEIDVERAITFIDDEIKFRFEKYMKD